MDIIFNPVCQIPAPCPYLHAEVPSFRHAGVNVIRVHFKITLAQACLPCTILDLGPKGGEGDKVEGKEFQFLYRKRRLRLQKFPCF